jgi:AraC-like DNA-binding protein
LTALRSDGAGARLSPSQFCRVFRQELDVGFGQCLLRYRIDRACEHLAHPGATAKAVADAVGFNELSYFTRAFKRRVGVCPSDYRAAARSS